MKLVLLSTLCLVASITADKSFPSDRELSHVVRVGRNGRQVIHRQPGARSGQGRKVVRKQRKGASRARQERQFVAPVPAPLTFNLPPPAPVAPAVRFAPAPAVAPIAPAFRVAPAPAVAPFATVAPAVRVAPAGPGRIVPFVHHAPALRIAPLAPAPLVSHIHHAAPIPVVAPAPVPAAAPIPVPVPAPAPAVEIVEVREIPLEYGAPSTVAPEVSPNNYLAPAVEVEEVAREAEPSYLAPVVEEVAREAEPSYLAPVAVEVEEVRDVDQGYLAPVEAEPSYLAPVESAPEPVEVEVVREVQNDYLAPRDSYIAVPEVEAVSRQQEYVPNVAANNRAAAKAEPIAIVRQVLNPPTHNPESNHNFESENGIKQEAEVTMKLVDDSQVAVMRGSYEYIGVDNKVYTVDWFADETGFHASAPHLPQSVVPNHPEVAAAVRAQIAFAAEEDAAAAASRTSNSYLAPEELPGYNY